MPQKIFLSVIFIFSIVLSNAQVTYIKLAGRSTQDLYYNVDETPDGGVIFGGLNNSDYSLTRCNSVIDTMWTSVPLSIPDVYLYNACTLKDGRYAIGGYFFNQGNEEAVLVITDTSGIATDTIYYPSSAWGMWGINVFAMPDSGVILSAYEDGYTCDNTLNYYRLDKNLNPIWSQYLSTCDASVSNSKGFGKISERMYFLREYDYYYDPATGNFYSAPTVISIDMGNNILLDTTYSLSEKFTGISTTDDGGAVLFGALDTLGSKEISLMRISSNGTVLWKNTFGSIYDDSPVNVLETNDHGFAILSTQLLPNTNADVDMQFFKLDSLGQLQFTNVYGSSGNESGIDMIKKSDGSLLLLGRTNGFGSKVNMVILLDSTGQLNTGYNIQSLSNHYCAGDTAVLSVSPAASHYQWSTGDTTATIKITTTQNIQLTVTDSLGDSHVVPFYTVYFDSPPQATINGSAFSICGTQSAQLSVPSGTGNTYQWFHNGTLIDTANYRIYFASVSGIYRAVVANACGTDTSSLVTVTSHQLPITPQVTVSPSNHVCSTTPVVLTTNSAPDSIHWKWTGNDIVADTLILNQPKQYYLSVTATNSFGCVSPVQYVQVIIDGTPQIDLTDSLLMTCIPGSTQLPYTYSASYGTFTFIANTTVTGTFNYPVGFYAYGSGIYYANLTNSCGSYTDSVIVVANVKPPIDVFPNNPSICSGTPLLLTCLSPGLYQWTNSSGSVISTDSVCLIPGVAFNNYYYLKVTDPATNCYSDINIPVSTNTNIPPVINNNPDTLICSGGQVTLYAGDFNSYLWSTGDNSAAVTLYNNGISDTIFYTVTVVDSSNCSSTDTIRVIYDICAGLPETNSSDKIKIYPNPSSDKMIFELTGNVKDKKAELYLFDFTGRAVLSKEFKGAFIDINANDFPSSGYYYLIKLTDEYFKGSVEFIK